MEYSNQPLPKSETSDLDQAPGKENTDGLKLFRLIATEPTVRTHPEFDTLQAVVGAFNSYKIYTDRYFQEVPDDSDIDQSFQKTKPIVDNLWSIWPVISRTRDEEDMLVKLMNANYLIDAPGNILGRKMPNQDDQVQPEVKYPEDAQFIDISVQNVPELEGIILNLTSLDHDSRNRIQPFRLGIQLAQRYQANNQPDRLEAIVKKLRSNFVDLKSYLDTEATIKLLDKYPREQLTGLDLQGVIDGYLRPLLQERDIALGQTGLIVNEHTVGKFRQIQESLSQDYVGVENGTNLVKANPKNTPVLAEIEQALAAFETHDPNSSELILDISPQLLHYFDTIFSKQLFGEIAFNVASNAEKTFTQRSAEQPDRDTTEPKQVRFLVNMSSPNTTEFIFEDNGSGVDEEIEREGIQKLKSKWGGGVAGTGEGLYGQMIIVEGKYSGKMTLKSVVKDGIKKGARLSVVTKNKKSSLQDLGE